jgi:hypothetical protein
VIRVPGEGPKVPPQVPQGPSRKDVKDETMPSRPMPAEAKSMGGKGPYELDSHSMAVALAALANEAKEKELSFEEIIQKVIDETGMTNPQQAMEEANRKLHKEIEETLDEIKKNKGLMDEAQAWDAFARILDGKLSDDQKKEFLSLLGESIKSA